MNLGAYQVAIATLATILMIGLGYIARPAKATALWSLAFTVAMIATFASAASFGTGVEVIRVLALAALLVTPGLMWSGLRADRGAPSMLWVCLVVVITTGTVLALTQSTTAYSLTFRLSFLTTAMFSVLVLIELERRPERGRGVAYPLSIVSVLTGVVGVAGVVSAIIAPTLEVSALGTLRTVNVFGFPLVVVCALVTLLFFARGGVEAAQSTDRLQEVGAVRLARAASRYERGWAVLEVRIDDADAVRVAIGDTAFSRLVGEVRERVTANVPADADVSGLGDGRASVVLCRPTPILQALAHSLVSDLSHGAVVDDRMIPFSASAGWASADDLGYDFDVLRDAASEAASQAESAGGDRVERAAAKSLKGAADPSI